MEKDAKYWINKLELLAHPEGGFYKEVYRDAQIISKDAIPISFKGDRNSSTAIYYLLEKENYSSFHRIQSDEIWHLYNGSSVNIYYFKEGELFIERLGLNLEKGESPMCIIPKNTWFAAELINKKSYSLMGCTVAPGFDFADFEKATRNDLLEYLHKHNELITRLT